MRVRFFPTALGGEILPPQPRPVVSEHCPTNQTSGLVNGAMPSCTIDRLPTEGHPFRSGPLGIHEQPLCKLEAARSKQVCA